MANNVNLNKLKEEINSRKREKNMVSSNLNENVGTGVAPRDTFLNGLLESLKTGRETASTALVKTVENKVSDKLGEKTKLSVSNTSSVQRQSQPQRLSEIDMSPERDEQMFVEFDKMKNKTLAETIEGYTKTPYVGAPMQQQSMQQPTMINENYLTENIKKTVNNYLSENFSLIVEEAIKNTILEMYAVERIKEVLHENKDLIRTVVIETIREIQAKNKAKAQS